PLGQSAATCRALASAKASAQSAADRPSAVNRALIDASSIPAGLTINSRSASASSFCRAALDEARIRHSSVQAMFSRQQLHDRRRCFLDRATRHVDDGPAPFSKNPSCFADLHAYCIDVGVPAGVVVVQYIQAMTAELNQPLRVIGQ